MRQFLTSVGNCLVFLYVKKGLIRRPIPFIDAPLKGLDSYDLSIYQNYFLCKTLLTAFSIPEMPIP
jgi:hypothetical protein